MNWYHCWQALSESLAGASRIQALETPDMQYQLDDLTTARQISWRTHIVAVHMLGWLCAVWTTGGFSYCTRHNDQLVTDLGDFFDLKTWQTKRNDICG
jgi:hypothetical protein